MARWKGSDVGQSEGGEVYSLNSSSSLLSNKVRSRQAFIRFNVFSFSTLIVFLFSILCGLIAYLLSIFRLNKYSAALHTA